MTTSTIVLICMAAAIAAAGFAPVTPDVYAGYLKAAATVFTGLAGLFLHPPVPGQAPPAAADKPAETPPRPTNATGPRPLVVAIALLSAAIALSACAPHAVVAAGVAVSGMSGALNVADKVTEAVNPVIDKACSIYQADKSVADVLMPHLPAKAQRVVASLKTYADAACQNPPAGDAVATAIWLGELAGQIRAAAQPAAP